MTTSSRTSRPSSKPDGVLPLEQLAKRDDAKLRREGFRTYDGWLTKDRQVLFGEKARHFDSRGRALFHLEQTTVPKEYAGSDWDSDDWEDDSFDGDPWGRF